MKSTCATHFRLLTLTCCLLFCFLSACGQEGPKAILSVHGAVEKDLSLSIMELQAMPAFHINFVANLQEKQSPKEEEKLVDIANFEGVLLRDLLEKAGMDHKKKFEPGVFFRVRGEQNKEVIFSFGEIMYSSIGRSTMIAWKKDGKSVQGLELVVSNDIRNGRRLSGVSEVLVERVDIEMKVYEEQAKNLVQPPTSQLEILDKRIGKSCIITLADLIALPQVSVDEKVQIGDCEGFRGIHSYRGATLRSLLQKEGFITFPLDYSRYVAITSKNGFSATYSIGELFNSKLANNIIIAYEKDGSALSDDEAFAMMLAVEDSTGGRSVKRISNIYID